MMGFIDLESRPAIKPPVKVLRPRRPRVIAGFESEIRQLYRQVLEEPVPPHLRAILRTALAPKT